MSLFFESCPCSLTSPDQAYHETASVSLSAIVTIPIFATETWPLTEESGYYTKLGEEPVVIGTKVCLGAVSFN